MRTALSTAAISLVAAIVLAGCGPQAEGDPGLTVYLSAPLSGPRAADGQDITDGAELAIADAGGESAGTAITLETLDDADAGGWNASRSGANARLAAQDSTAIAYVGELDSGASRTSIPITNEAGMLQVSPGSGAEDLTRAALGSSDVPSVQASGARTFGRVIPSDRDQGEAAAVWMSRRGIATVQLVGAETDFAQALVAGLRSAPSAPAIEGGPADALFDVRSDPLEPASSGRSRPPSRPLFGSDVLLGEGRPGSLERIRLTSAALDPSQLPPTTGPFLADFRRTYGREPGRYAAYGYEVVAVVLDSIDRASDPLSRSAVIDAFLATRDRASILGTYSIDPVGNTTLGQLGAYVADERQRPVPTPKPLELP